MKDGGEGFFYKLKKQYDISIIDTKNHLNSTKYVLPWIKISVLITE